MKIFLVYRNSDLTEGRGPMVLDKIFLDRERSIKFALKQPGVMGITGRQNWLDKAKLVKLLGTDAYKLVDGDWEVYQVEIE